MLDNKKSAGSSRVCYTCDHSNHNYWVYNNSKLIKSGKIIEPTDKQAMKTDIGWICGVCINANLISLFGGVDYT